MNLSSLVDPYAGADFVAAWPAFTTPQKCVRSQLAELSGVSQTYRIPSGKIGSALPLWFIRPNIAMRLLPLRTTINNGQVQRTSPVKDVSYRLPRLSMEVKQIQQIGLRIGIR